MEKIWVTLALIWITFTTTPTSATGTGELDVKSFPKNFTALKDGGCYMTKCQSYAYCKFGDAEILVDDQSGACLQGLQRKLCCQHLAGCEDTTCRPHRVDCPPGRKEWSRDANICASSAPTPVMTTLLCCNEGIQPPCFNTSCSPGRGDPCPKGYEDADMGTGERWGCPYGGNWVYTKRTCCLSEKRVGEGGGAAGWVGENGKGFVGWVMLVGFWVREGIYRL